MTSSKDPNTIIIAVMSDLHCHHSTSFPKGVGKGYFKDTYLISDDLTSDHHPVKSLISLIKSEGISTNIMLTPGDLTNKVDTQGFISGWEAIKKVSEALDVDDIYATLGNHDVDSRSDGDSFKTAKNLEDIFPFKPEHCNEGGNFWLDGFCFIEEDNYRLLIINSTLHHLNETEAKRGKIEQSQIIKIAKYLEENKDEKIKLAMCHHHPIQHERHHLGSDDLMINGSTLIEKLNEFNFDLLIHGHKHDAWIRYSQGGNHTIPVFAAGSFSAITNHMITNSRNTFHIIEVKKSSDNNSTGIIKTWEYLYNYGWVAADSGDYFFPYKTGFGYRGDLDKLTDKIVRVIEAAPGNKIVWEKFIESVPEIENLIPIDSKIIMTKLLNFDIQIAPSITAKPEIIGKIYNPNH